MGPLSVGMIMVTVTAVVIIFIIISVNILVATPVHTNFQSISDKKKAHKPTHTCI